LTSATKNAAIVNSAPSAESPSSPIGEPQPPSPTEKRVVVTTNTMTPRRSARISDKKQAGQERKEQ
jgi:hypothetical protein